MLCPVDSARMNQLQSGTVQYEGCPSCSGVWFGPRHLATLDLPAHLRPRSLKALALMQGKPGGKIRYCDDCDKTLLAATIENVAVDICPSCGGAWLDASVFGSVLSWYEERQKNKKKDDGYDDRPDDDSSPAEAEGRSSAASETSEPWHGAAPISARESVTTDSDGGIIAAVIDFMSTICDGLGTIVGAVGDGLSSIGDAVGDMDMDG